MALQDLPQAADTFFVDAPAQLAGWIGGAVDQVVSEVAQSRALVGDACARLGASFAEIADHAPPAHIDQVVAALQFEDLVSQLLGGVIAKLEAMRRVCDLAAGDPADPSVAAIRDEAQRVIDRALVHVDAAPGDVELF